jgi:hypothetical protein
MPEDPRSRLSDVEYAIAARLSLGLQPYPAKSTAILPEHCPLCTGLRAAVPVSLKREPWHMLTCTSLFPGELSRRHNAVVDTIARVAWMVEAQVQREVAGLDPSSAARPDLHIVFPGRVLLTDVTVSYSLTASNVLSGRSTATDRQRRKNSKYGAVASRIGAELLNVSIDACGGLASDAGRLVQAIAEEGETWSAGTWSSNAIERYLLGAISVAIQRGNALAMLTGYSRATARAGRGTGLY